MGVAKTPFKAENTLKRFKQKLFTFFCFSFLVFSAFLFNGCSKKDYSEFCASADEFLEAQGFQGTVLVAEKDKIIYAKGFGSSDEKHKKSPENSVDTVYEIGSITKQMTAAAIMQQVEKGKLSLDDTIDRFFPDYKYAPQITVRMLLNMRSGLLDHINGPEEFFGARQAKNIAKKEMAGKPVDRDLVLKALYKAELLTKPDTTYFYSNTNYYLLALILEQVSGLTYDHYMQKNIFEKAEMKTANVEFQKTDSAGYYRGNYYSIPRNMALGCGDVNAGVMDLLAWNRAYAGGKIISKKSFKEVTDSESYGFGVYCSENSILHSGSTYCFNSYNEYFPAEKISIIVLSNKPQFEMNATMVAGRIKKLFFPPVESEKQEK